MELLSLIYHFIVLSYFLSDFLLSSFQRMLVTYVSNLKVYSILLVLFWK